MPLFRLLCLIPRLRISGLAPNLPKDVAVTYEITGVLSSDPAAVALGFGLGPVWPQPVILGMNASVSVSIPVEREVSLVLYDIFGRERGVLHRGMFDPRVRDFTFSPSALSLTPGTYILRLYSGAQHATRKFTVIQ